MKKIFALIVIALVAMVYGTDPTTPTNTSGPLEWTSEYSANYSRTDSLGDVDTLTYVTDRGMSRPGEYICDVKFAHMTAGDSVKFEAVYYSGSDTVIANEWLDTLVGTSTHTSFVVPVGGTAFPAGVTIRAINMKTSTYVFPSYFNLIRRWTAK